MNAPERESRKELLAVGTRSSPGRIGTRRPSRISAARHLIFPGMILCLAGCDAPSPGAGKGADVNGPRVVHLETGPTADTLTAANVWQSSGGPRGFVQPVDLAVDHDGDVLVLDAGTSSVVRLSERGDLKASFGRHGSGPGEFGSGLSRVLVSPTGEIYVPDRASARMDVFDAAGKYLHSLRMAFGSGLPAGFAVLDDRHVYRAATSLGRDEHGAGVSEPFIHVYELRPDSTIEIAKLSAGQASRGGLYTAWPQWAAAANRVAVSAIDSFTVRFFDTTFALREEWSGSWTPQPISSADQDILLNQAFHRLPDNVRQQTIAALRARLQFASGYPPLAGLLIGDNGTVWMNAPVTADEVRRGEAPGFTFDDIGSVWWQVYSPTGAHLGNVKLPVGFHLRQVRNGLLYGIAADSSDNPVVEVLKVSALGM